MLMVFIERVLGLRLRSVCESKMHPYRGREWWPVNDYRATYTAGYAPPRYPVPALPDQTVNAHPVVLYMFKQIENEIRSALQPIS